MKDVSGLRIAQSLTVCTYNNYSHNSKNMDSVVMLEHIYISGDGF